MLSETTWKVFSIVISPFSLQCVQFLSNHSLFFVSETAPHSKWRKVEEQIHYICTVKNTGLSVSTQNCHIASTKSHNTSKSSDKFVLPLQAIFGPEIGPYFWWFVSFRNRLSLFWRALGKIALDFLQKIFELVSFFFARITMNSSPQWNNGGSRCRFPRRPSLYANEPLNQAYQMRFRL